MYNTRHNSSPRTGNGLLPESSNAKNANSNSPNLRRSRIQTQRQESTAHTTKPNDAFAPEAKTTLHDYLLIILEYLLIIDASVDCPMCSEYASVSFDVLEILCVASSSKPSGIVNIFSIYVACSIPRSTRMTPHHVVNGL